MVRQAHKLLLFLPPASPSLPQSMFVVPHVVGVSKVESFPNERATHKQKKKQEKKMKNSNLATRFCHVTPHNKTKQKNLIRFPNF